MSLTQPSHTCTLYFNAPQLLILQLLPGTAATFYPLSLPIFKYEIEFSIPSQPTTTTCNGIARRGAVLAESRDQLISLQLRHQNKNLMDGQG
jgi:hypothetical protein